MRIPFLLWVVSAVCAVIAALTDTPAVLKVLLLLLTVGLAALLVWARGRQRLALIRTRRRPRFRSNRAGV